MIKVLTLTVLFLLPLCKCTPLLADIITINGIVKSVDPKRRTITIESGTNEKTLDVSSKAKIVVGDKSCMLDDLSPGSHVSLSYHGQLEVVLKVESENILKPPKLIELLELNDGKPSLYPWPTEDGQTLFWESQDGSGESSIWVARRKDPMSVYEGKRMLFKGRHPTATSDGTELMFTVDGVLHTTSREVNSDSWRRPEFVEDIPDRTDVKGPCLSPNGLTLYFNASHSKEGNSRIYFTNRLSRDSKWSPIKPLPIHSKEFADKLSWIDVLEGENIFFCCHGAGGAKSRVRNGKGNLMLWMRADSQGSFSNHQYIDLGETGPLNCRSPRYVASTRELFLTNMNDDSRGGICVVKNFDLSRFLR